MAEKVVVCAAWGYLLDSVDVRYLVKEYLDKRGMTMKRFKDSIPSREWVFPYSDLLSLF